MNEEKLGSMWRNLSSSPKGIIFQVVLEAVLKNKLERSLGQEATKILPEPIRKQSV